MTCRTQPFGRIAAQTALCHRVACELFTQTRVPGRLAITRGVRLTADDRLRRDVITQLMCNLALRFDEFEAAYGIRFADTFAPELRRLRGFEEDGLVSINPRTLDVRMAGRMLVRSIAMVFDRYLGQQAQTQFSRTV